MAGGDSVDGTALRFLVMKALERQEEEEKEKAKEEKRRLEAGGGGGGAHAGAQPTGFSRFAADPG